MEDQFSPPSPPEEHGAALPLRQAALVMCAPQVVADLRAAHAAFQAAQGKSATALPFPTDAEQLILRFIGSGNQSGLVMLEIPGETNALRHAKHALSKALILLETDLRQRVASGEVMLEGLKMVPSIAEAPQRLPGAWAKHLVFFWEYNEVRVQGEPFSSVTAALCPSGSQQTNSETRASTSRNPVTPENIGTRGDEEILQLLEENHRRVINTSGARVFAPGKLSFIDLILRKMTARAAAGELLPTLAEEGNWLAEWIKSKIPSHQPPSSGAIKNALRSQYRDLKAQSKGMTQSKEI